MTLHVEKISVSFLALFNNTSFVGMKEAVCSPFSEDGPDNGQPAAALHTGQEQGWPEDTGRGTRKEKQTNKQTQRPGTNPESSEIRTVRRSRHQGPGPTSRREGPASGPPAGSPRRAPAAGPVCPVQGSPSDALSVKKLSTVPDIFGPPEKQLHSLHGCEVNLYVKLSHSGLSKNVMCLA